MDDAEHEQDAVVAEGVVHDAVVADAEAVEGVGLAEDRFHFLAADATGAGCGGGELFEACADPLPHRVGEFRVGAFGGWSEAYLVGVAQAISLSGVERPRR